MSNNSPTSGFWNYVAECIRLLYWAYFKPFTFGRWLHDIHLQLEPRFTPFERRSEFRTNSRLRRYAGQVWWLTVLIPIFAVLLVAPVYTLFSGESFNWFRSSIVLMGWLIGRVLDRASNRSRTLVVVVAVLAILLASWFLSGVVLDVALSLAGGLVLGVFGGVVLSLGGGMAAGLALSVVFGVGLSVGFGLARGIAFGAALGLTASVVFGSVLGLAFGVTLGLVLDLAEFVAFGVAAGLLIGLVLGVMEGVAAGVLQGIAVGIAVVLTWIFGCLRVYFWLPELLWIFILFLISRFQKQGNYLQYLPSRYNELIMLPLPFMDRMIVEGYKNNPVIACETIDYLITSTNKQKVALQAIIKITIDIFNECQRLGDIADIASQLTWIPSPPPKELGTVLPQFFDISQGVRAAQEATSLYRQYELLKFPINTLQELKSALAFEKNVSLAAQFGSITNRWITILETAKRTLEDTVRQSKEIPQAYIAGNSLDPITAKNRFKGRIDIFREIESLTLSDQPPVLLLYGGRRTGKTSALKYLPYRIGANIIPLLVDVQGAASATTLKAFAEKLAEQIIAVARRLPRKIHLPNPDAKKLAEDPFPALQTWLAEIERSNPGKRFLLCLDEYEKLSEVVAATNSRAPLNFIRNLMQHQKQWILLFSGYRQLSELDAYWSDYLINTIALRMSYLQESEARELILQPIEDFSNIYESTAVDMIIQLTRCQPYLVQLMCYVLVEFLNRDIRANRREADTVTATIQDVQEIIPIVLERGNQYFWELWMLSLTENDRNLLRRIIQGQTPTPQDKGTVKRLIRKEILTQEGNAFQVPLVQRAIEQFIEEES